MDAVKRIRSLDWADLGRKAGRQMLTLGCLLAGVAGVVIIASYITLNRWPGVVTVAGTVLWWYAAIIRIAGDATERARNQWLSKTRAERAAVLSGHEHGEHAVGTGRGRDGDPRGARG